MDVATIPDKSLTECLELVERVFNPHEITARQCDADALAEYYRQSDRGYRLFHSAEGALHLGLSDDGQFDGSGLYGQAEIVQRHLESLPANDVMEAGSGNGFNLVYLAEKNPTRHFVGVDWNESHLLASRKSGSQLPNLKFRSANYEAMDFETGSFDLIFAVESLCQTGGIQAALVEFHRVLRPGGLVIWIDCFRKVQLDGQPAEMQLAAQLVERVTAVNQFPLIQHWHDAARQLGYNVQAIDELTMSVGPNLERLYGLARRFFNMSSGLWAMKKVFPPLLLQNAVCGLLAPFTFGAGVHGYYSLVMEKSE